MNTHKYFHLSEIDHTELLEQLLSHFGESKPEGDRGYRFQTKGTNHYLDVLLGKTGSIQKISASPDFSQTQLAEIEKELSDTFLKDQSKKIGEWTCFSHSPVNGFYKYKDLFLIVPIEETAPQLPYSYGDHPFILRFQYMSSKNPSIDASRRFKTASEYVKILNLLCNRRIFMQHNTGKFEWVINHEDGITTSRWTQVLYVTGLEDRTFTDLREPSYTNAINTTEYQTYYSQHYRDGSDLKLPDNLDQSLEIVFRLDIEKRRKFDLAISWLYQTDCIWEVSKSSAYIALISSLESLIDKSPSCKVCSQPLCTKYGHCNACKQTIFGLTKEFKLFLEKYTDLDSSFDREKNLLYKLRSDLVHGMDMLATDLNIFQSMHYKSELQNNLYRNLRFITKIAIYNWIHMTS